jgi:signal peptidase I
MGQELSKGPSTARKSIARELVETVVFTMLIYALIRVFLFENYRVLGHSMDPSLENDQFLVVDKLEYRLRDPERGDIIVFHDPNSDRRKLIKRVIGLPGEMIEIRNGQVLVNERPLDEPYITMPAAYSRPPTPVPDGYYYVLGDNRNNSSDSHNWGPLEEEQIVGNAWISYWPPRLWDVISPENYGDGL